MRKTLLSISWVFCLVTIAIGQDIRKSCPWKNSFDVLLDKPTIYISFEKEGLVSAEASIDDDMEGGLKSNRYVWARLHNNTAQGIYVFAMNALVLYTNSVQNQQSVCSERRVAVKEDDEVEVEYYADPKPGAKSVTPNLSWHSTTAGPIWVIPGKSLLFKIPYKDLGFDWDIKIPYHYEWEDDIKSNDSRDKRAGDEEPRHFVYFRFYKLPESIKREILK